MERITQEEYFGPYAAQRTPELIAAATGLLAKVNLALEAVVEDGVALFVNPHTGTYVSGEGHGGYRGTPCDVGAAHSKHRIAHAVDVYDPRRAIARWALEHPARMKDLGLYMEDPRWTPTWCHLQDVPPVSHRLTFIPYDPAMVPPLAAALPGQVPV